MPNNLRYNRNGVSKMKTTKNQKATKDILRRTGYVTDNLARAQAEPAYRPEVETRPERKRRTATQSAPLIGIRKSMGFWACTVMLACLAIILYNAVLFANVHAKTNELDREITALTNEYANLSRTNDEAEQAIASSVDINRVYEVAVGQYGMVYPCDNEIVTFAYQGEGYVRQYSPVAEEEKPEESVFERILGKILR